MFLGHSKAHLGLLALFSAHEGKASSFVKEPFLSIHLPQVADAFEAPQELQRKAGLATCPAGVQFVDVCIDSAMNIDTTGYIDGGSIPATPHGAVGPNSLIAVSGNAIECLGKDGTAVFGPTSLDDMFASLSPTFLFHPKIRYDIHQHRFVVVVLDRIEEFIVTDSNIMLAVSKNNNPKTTTATDWYFRKFPSLLEDYFVANTGIAMDEEAIYIATDMWYFHALLGIFKSLLWVIPKTDLYAGHTPVWAVHDYIEQTGKVGSYANFVPATVRSPTGIPSNVGTYLVAYGGMTGNSIEYVQVIQIKNPLMGTTFRHAFVQVGNIDSADQTLEIPDAPQAGTSVLIDAGAQVALDAVWANNALWMVFTTKKATGQAAAYWVKLRADGVAWPPTPLDHGPIDGEAIGEGMCTFFPSMDVNSKGVAAFGFSASSASSFVSAYATIRNDPVDSLGKVRTPDLVKAGVAPYNLHLPDGDALWGFYSGTSMDPADEDCFWVFNAYAGPNNFTEEDGLFGEWKTAWARLCYSLAGTPAPTKPPTNACLTASKPCAYNSKKNVCCDAQKLVCRKYKSSNKLTCQKCLGIRKSCKKAYECCSKKCGKVQSKTGTFCIKK